jgi:hypothetical protein
MEDMTEPSPQWSQDQGIAYETVRESFNEVIGMCMASVYEEQGKPNPNPDRLAFLRLRVSQLHDLRHVLSVTDDASVAEIQRDLTAIIRADKGLMA